MNKKLKLILMWAIIIITAIVVVLSRGNRLFPLKVANGTADIKTQEINNPKVKTVIFRAYAVNRTNKTLAFRLHFTKNDDDAEWYPYYNIIPVDHVTEIYHLEPGEVQEFKSKVIVNSEDDRSINSSFYKMKIEYEIINK